MILIKLNSDHVASLLKPLQWLPVASLLTQSNISQRPLSYYCAPLINILLFSPLLTASDTKPPGCSLNIYVYIWEGTISEGTAKCKGSMAEECLVYIYIYMPGMHIRIYVNKRERCVFIHIFVYIYCLIFYLKSCLDAIPFKIVNLYPLPHILYSSSRLCFSFWY